MIIRRAQFNMIDVWDNTKEGWRDNHTRCRIIKTPSGKKAIHIAGVFLPKIRYVEIAKSC